MASPLHLEPAFFDRDACVVARALLGKVLRRRHGEVWLSAVIVETEAYFRRERGSHASLGRTPSREALFMPPGTIYMYHSRAGGSLNVSCRGAGDAVLIKAARPLFDARSPEATSRPVMERNNPLPGGRTRPTDKLCAGQALLCRALSLRIGDWNGQRFDEHAFYLEDAAYAPERVVVARRLGIAPGRDEHLLYRYVDAAHAPSATRDPLRVRGAVEGVDYFLLRPGAADPNVEGAADPNVPGAADPLPEHASAPNVLRPPT